MTRPNTKPIALSDDRLTAITGLDSDDVKLFLNELEAAEGEEQPKPLLSASTLQLKDRPLLFARLCAILLLQAGLSDEATSTAVDVISSTLGKRGVTTAASWCICRDAKPSIVTTRAHLIDAIGRTRYVAVIIDLAEAWRATA